MIIVRNVFRLRFGQARQAIAVWKEGIAMMKRAGYDVKPRLLTDLVGPSYTLVFETTHDDLASYEKHGRGMMGNDEWRTWYEKFVPLAESSCREIFNVVE